MKIKNIPLPISGLILALLSMGKILEQDLPYLTSIFLIIGLILMFLVILKIVLYPKSVINDFKNPVILSSFGTFSMSLMILSTYILKFTSTFAYIIWILGISIHILLMIYFTYRFIIHNFNIHNVYPTYWIVYVGITMGAITSHAHNIEEIGFIFFIIGFISMLITTPLIIYRYIKYNDINDMNKPLICIFTALYSILIVGYLNSTQNISIPFIVLLYSLSCAFYIFALYKLISYRKLEFYPSFSAFTFPFIISANATKQIINIFPNILLTNILSVEITIGILLIAYVLIKYFKFLKTC